MWAALAAGPLALAIACAVPRTVTAAAQPTTSAPAALRTVDPAGAASLFCDLWLRSDRAAADSSTAHALRVLAPSVDLPDRSGQAAAQSLSRTVAVRSAQQDDGSWSVIVAAQFTVPGGKDGSNEGPGASSIVRYFAVPVVAADGASGSGAFTVTAAPAEVAGPATAKVAESRFEDPLPADGAVVSSLGEFFSAYLAGVGEVGRYLSPGTELDAVRGSGYQSVAVETAAADSEVAGGAVPGDGTVVRVQARVTATDTAGGRWPLVYTLAMTARSGRWEVTALQAGSSGKPATAKPSPATVGGAAK
ncbi:conjugal transfer protein [Streptomyces sp. NBC_01619]|uniref:conjugal transfer protein n=1 Tax=Streptomyces sp. NBC_01619 TaxID=2975901 RepID=UPI002256F9B7|nr:conjugal transfer protein [Streptomyces sp. NBC_01619]MCX4515925.1 conjugal transfer protein [Streptomyces sp. NBC_01619]